ncbi:MAG: HAD-IIB family hydrolase [Calditrichaeota bacterium]|nr:HAD-IIB family hydrolase [Calditrichota bacterium]
MIQIPDKLLRSLGKISVIYTDVDGTFVSDGCLFRNRSGYSLKNAQAIFELLQENIDVVMISGREKEKLRETARILGFRNYIGNLGIEIVYNQGEKVITNFGVDVPDHQSLKKWIEKSGVLEAIFQIYPGKVEFYEPWSDILRTHHLLIGELEYSSVQEFVSEKFPELRIIDNGLVPPYGNFSRPHAYHVLPAKAGKRAAVTIDKKERNLKSRNLIGIGDSNEDASLASEVGIFFLLDKDVMSDRENVVYIDNEDGEGFSRIVSYLIEKNFI